MIRYIIVNEETEEYLARMDDSSKPDTWHWGTIEGVWFADPIPATRVQVFGLKERAKQIVREMRRADPDLKKLKVQKVKAHRIYELI